MNRKTISLLAMACFILSTLVSLMVMSGTGQTFAERGVRLMGKFCIAQIYPSIWQMDDEQEAEPGDELNIETATVKKKVVKKDPANKADNTKPQVIIYHTHSSESYQPYTESNYHRQEVTGTVRDVGNVMTAELNKLGIGVVHDKTIHDSPSYNESYERSMETISSLIKKYPTATVVIDLHRDAAAYTGNVGETMKINGETVAKYKLVVGQANDNYDQLMEFANKINSTADSLYPGFTGRIIEKEYNYNEYIADRYLLLEVGNNQNDIGEVRKTGKYFAHVLAKILEEI